MALQPDDLVTVTRRVRGHATCTMADASVLLGRSLNRCYQDARERGEVGSIHVIHLSERSIRLPSRPLLRLVGLEDDDQAGSGGTS